MADLAATIDGRLAAVLPPGALYAVGGRVRDEVRSAFDGVARPAQDLDYVVTGLELPELIARVASLGRADVVGAAFAVVKLTLAGTTVDLALPRRERSTGRGHRDFAVESGPDIPLEDDLGRRDFRMNMLARALPSGALVDPYGGEADIRARQIDLLRPEAFDEDPLRMLRACQFAARFGFVVTPVTLAALERAAPLIATVSPERIRDELNKLLAEAPRPSEGLELMRRGGLLALILPEIAEGIGIEQNEYHAYDVFEHTLATLDASPTGDLSLRLAALFHDVAKPRTREVAPDGTHFYGHERIGAEIVHARLGALRYPGELVELVARLVKNHMYVADFNQEAKTIRRFVRRVGSDALERQFALRAADIAGRGLPPRGDHNERFEARVHELLAERPPLRVADLAVGGEEIIALLVAAGRLPAGSKGDRQVGALLAQLMEWVLDDPRRNDSGQLLRYASELAREPEEVPRETLR